jgi:hypothetical protein
MVVIAAGRARAHRGVASERQHLALRTPPPIVLRVGRNRGGAFLWQRVVAAAGVVVVAAALKQAPVFAMTLQALALLPGTNATHTTSSLAAWNSRIFWWHSSGMSRLKNAESRARLSRLLNAS